MNTNVWMVILTATYVVATIAICIANWKTIKEMREDRRVNSAIMLYHDRESVLKAFAKHDYDAIAGQVALLFGMDYYLRMDAIAHREKESLSIEERNKLNNDRSRLFTEMAEFTKESITF